MILNNLLLIALFLACSGWSGDSSQDDSFQEDNLLEQIDYSLWSEDKEDGNNNAYMSSYPMQQISNNFSCDINDSLSNNSPSIMSMMDTPCLMPQFFTDNYYSINQSIVQPIINDQIYGVNPLYIDNNTSPFVYPTYTTYPLNINNDNYCQPPIQPISNNMLYFNYDNQNQDNNNHEEGGLEDNQNYNHVEDLSDKFLIEINKTEQNDTTISKDRIKNLTFFLSLKNSKNNKKYLNCLEEFLKLSVRRVGTLYTGKEKFMKILVAKTLDNIRQHKHYNKSEKILVTDNLHLYSISYEKYRENPRPRNVKFEEILNEHNFVLEFKENKVYIVYDDSLNNHMQTCSQEDLNEGNAENVPPKECALVNNQNNNCMEDESNEFSSLLNDIKTVSLLSNSKIIKLESFLYLENNESNERYLSQVEKLLSFSFKRVGVFNNKINEMEILIGKMLEIIAAYKSEKILLANKRYELLYNQYEEKSDGLDEPTKEFKKILKDNNFELEFKEENGEIYLVRKEGHLKDNQNDNYVEDYSNKFLAEIANLEKWQSTLIDEQVKAIKRFIFLRNNKNNKSYLIASMKLLEVFARKIGVFYYAKQQYMELLIGVMLNNIASHEHYHSEKIILTNKRLYGHLYQFYKKKPGKLNKEFKEILKKYHFKIDFNAAKKEAYIVYNSAAKRKRENDDSENVPKKLRKLNQSEINNELIEQDL